MWDAEKVLTVSAAWVQAIGSITALIVAFKIAAQQSKRDDRRRDQEQRDRKITLYDMVSEARDLAQLAAVPHDRPSGEAFAASYDVVHAEAIITLLTARINSGLVDVKDITPAIKVLAEFSQLNELVKAYLPRMHAGQFSFDMRDQLFTRLDRIGPAVDGLKPTDR
ncbi:hypothetical protein [Methylobacterium brachiatum]|uniref:hypothetical protein n=1 Tax=Methylobacterium brachiatum TaxID=269660 RepID=UPI0024493816|nr:hypothetical protein [Methylobacterium brachiatum]MDH2310378.1 hypothetical protein [Methylobacterium brachiatum]